MAKAVAGNGRVFLPVIRLQRKQGLLTRFRPPDGGL
jgi:hypothetical protein